MSPNEIATVLRMLSESIESSEPAVSAAGRQMSPRTPRTTDPAFWRGEDPDGGRGPGRRLGLRPRRRRERAVAA